MKVLTYLSVTVLILVVLAAGLVFAAYQQRAAAVPPVRGLLRPDTPPVSVVDRSSTEESLDVTTLPRGSESHGTVLGQLPSDAADATPTNSVGPDHPSLVDSAESDTGAAEASERFLVPESIAPDLDAGDGDSRVRIHLRGRNHVLLETSNREFMELDADSLRQLDLRDVAMTIVVSRDSDFDVVQALHDHLEKSGAKDISIVIETTDEPDTTTIATDNLLDGDIAYEDVGGGDVADPDVGTAITPDAIYLDDTSESAGTAIETPIQFQLQEDGSLLYAGEVLTPQTLLKLADRGEGVIIHAARNADAEDIQKALVLLEFYEFESVTLSANMLSENAEDVETTALPDLEIRQNIPAADTDDPASESPQLISGFGQPTDPSRDSDAQVLVSIPPDNMDSAIEALEARGFVANGLQVRTVSGDGTSFLELEGTRAQCRDATTMLNSMGLFNQDSAGEPEPSSGDNADSPQPIPVDDPGDRSFAQSQYSPSGDLAGLEYASVIRAYPDPGSTQTDLEVVPVAGASANDVHQRMIQLGLTNAETTDVIERTNSILIRGTPEQLAPLRIAIKLLAADAQLRASRTRSGEQPTASNMDWSSSSRDRERGHRPTRMSATEFLERSWRVNELGGSGNPSQIRQQLAAEFQNRLRLQRTQVAAAKEELARIEERLATRERFADEIIDRRLQEIITGVDLSWESASNRRPGQSGARAPRPQPAPGTWQPASEMQVFPVQEQSSPMSGALSPSRPQTMNDAMIKPRQGFAPQFGGGDARAIGEYARGGHILCFTAGWCEPCRRQQVIINKVDERSNVIEVIDIQDTVGMELARTYEITAIPTTVFILNGDVMSKNIGVLEEGPLESLIRTAEHRAAGRSQSSGQGFEFISPAGSNAGPTRSGNTADDGEYQDRQPVDPAGESENHVDESGTVDSDPGNESSIDPGLNESSLSDEGLEELNPSNLTPTDQDTDDAGANDSELDASIPDDAIPNSTNPDEETPEDATPDDATSVNTPPDDATPDDPIPDDATSDDSASDNEFSDEAPDDTTPADVILEDASPI